MKIDAFFEKLFGLSQDGKVDGKGSPGIMQMAVTGPVFWKEVRVTHPKGPQQLFEKTCPASGDPILAASLRDLLNPVWVGLDQDSWGLDHGTWSVLVHVFPEADVPVIQLSIDAAKPPSYHLDLGSRLAPLRDEGVLIVGSGDIVHNLRLANFHWRKPYEWAVRFDSDVQRYLRYGDDEALIDYAKHPDGNLAVPTPDHYLRMLYVAGARRDGDELTVLVEGIDLASVSMKTFTLD